MSDDDPARYPALGRLLQVVDRPGNPLKILWLLAALCALVFAAEFTYTAHPHFAIEETTGFYAIYGFVMFTLLILSVRLLRLLVGRREDYYGDKAVDREAYPRDQLDMAEHDG